MTVRDEKTMADDGETLLGTVARNLRVHLEGGVTIARDDGSRRARDHPARRGRRSDDPRPAAVPAP